MTVIEQLPHGSRIAVIRLRSLGDCVLTTPALALLNQYRPDLQIGVCVEDHFAPLFENSPRVAAILKASPAAVRRWKPELCLNLHGGTRSQWMTALSGARWRAGFSHHSFTAAYNLKIPRAQRILGVNRTVHTAEHMASAFFALGVPLAEVGRAELPHGPSSVEGRYAVIHPFASALPKKWPADRFCELARYLELWNIRPVFLGGPSDDLSPFQKHHTFSGPLPEAMNLIAGSALFVGNDSGPAHMAAAFGIPSAVLFGTSNPAIWGPWRTDAEMIVAPDGLDHLPVSRVIVALERLNKFEEAHA